MHLKKGLFLIFILTSGLQLWGQNDDIKTEKVTIQGKVMTALVTDGDTVILADLDDVSITSPRSFSSVEDYRKYQLYRKYANKVYPYAKEAIKIFREVEMTTKDMKKRKKKRHTKKLQKQYMKLMEEATDLQRKGDIQAYAKKSEEAEKLMKEIEAMKRG